MSETLPENVALVQDFAAHEPSLRQRCTARRRTWMSILRDCWFLKFHQDATQFQHFVDTCEPVNNAPFQTDRFCG